jgi:hypothetical protein
LKVDGLAALEQQDSKAEDVGLGAEDLGRDVRRVDAHHGGGGGQALGHAERQPEVAEAHVKVGGL